MTGYHISIGYLSGDDQQKAWEALKVVVLRLCQNPARIAAEAERFGMDAATAWEYAQSYTSASLKTMGTEDSTLRIIEGQRAEGEPQIMQLAGGAGVSRTIKEAMRRAFCRLVMEDMHRKGLEINIAVA